MTDHKFFRRIYWMPVTVLVVGVLALALFVWINSIHRTLAMDFDIADAIMDIRIKIAESHFRLEEVLSGNASQHIDRTTDEIDAAIALVRATLNGGKSEHGESLGQIRDPNQRIKISHILSLLIQYRTISLERLRQRNAVPADPALYKHFHEVFNEIGENSRALETSVEKDIIKARAVEKNLHMAIFIVFILVVATAAAGLWYREARRRAADKALQEANEQLHVQAGELANHRERLAELVEERTAELIAANRQLQQEIDKRVRLESIAEAVTMMNTIGSIFAGIRHEIGNPINSANMILSVLQTRIGALSKENIEEYLQKIKGEIVKVQYLLGTLKNFNIYETQQPRNIEMKSFMNNCIPLFASDFAKNSIKFDTVFSAGDLCAYADPRAFQQVMLNILTNAMDAVAEKDDPRIVIQVESGEESIRIRVTDNGCGIPEEKRKKLYTPFFTTKVSGTGLGLIIVKKLLAGMNGSIDIKSLINEGTSVELEIPRGSG